MLDVPAVHPGVVLVIILAGTHPSREIVVEVRYEVPLLVLGMEEQCLRIEKEGIILRPFPEIFRIFLISSRFRKFGQSPAIVCRTKADRHRLAVLPTDIGIRLYFPVTEGGDISVFPIETVNLSGRIPGPWNQRLLSQRLLSGLESRLRIDLEPLCHGVGESRDTVVAVHPPGIPGHFRERRHPSGSHLVRHPQERSEYILFQRLVHKGPERMGRPVGIPDPVIGIERSASVLMDLIVIGAPVTAVLAEAYGPLESPVVGCVKNSLSIFVTLYPDPPEVFVPDPSSFGCQSIHVIAGNLPPEIRPGLSDVDERDSVTEPYHRFPETEGHPAVVTPAGRIHLGRHHFRLHEYIYPGLAFNGLPSFQSLTVPGDFPSPAGQDNLEWFSGLQ